MTAQATLPLENFIQAVQSQLDKAQSAMAVKARNLNLPMTFAIKDINLDLRAHVEFSAGEIRIRPAGADEPQASTFHIVFTAITRPMIEENAAALSTDPEDQALDTLDEALTEEERRKLEWVGVRTVGKLRELERAGEGSEIGRVTNLPVDRLRKALRRASAPLVEEVSPVDRPEAGDDTTPDRLRRILKIRGRNLTEEGRLPSVKIDGRPAPILKATPKEILLAPAHDQWSGRISLDSAPDLSTAFSFDLSAFVTDPAAAPAAEAPATPSTGNGHGNGSFPPAPERRS